MGAVSPMVEMICMRMMMMGGTNAQVIGIEGAVHLLVMGTAHSWEEEVNHPAGHLAHQEVPSPTRVPIRAISPLILVKLTTGMITTMIMGNTPTTSEGIPQGTIDTVTTMTSHPSLVTSTPVYSQSRPHLNSP